MNREEERELMKDVPGWVVGTWYGEKVKMITCARFFSSPRLDLSTGKGSYRSKEKNHKKFV